LKNHPLLPFSLKTKKPENLKPRNKKEEHFLTFLVFCVRYKNRRVKEVEIDKK
jgi:hypothetical protein